MASFADAVGEMQPEVGSDRRSIIPRFSSRSAMPLTVQ
jgi:hypothetical protein